MTETHELTRAERKRRAIADAATEAFLANGYKRTSMDDIARLAGVSKQTIYLHFGDKERLLLTTVLGIMNAISQPFDDEIHRLAETETLDADLTQHARQQLALVMQPRPLLLRRLVIAEAASFPQLGQKFYELGPGRTINELTSVFRRLGERGRLQRRRPGASGVGLQLAGHVRTDQPGDAPRRVHRPERSLDRDVGGSSRPHLPRCLHLTADAFTPRTNLHTV